MATTKDPRPRSQQIAAELRAKILSKDLLPGSKLPSTAQIMEEYGVPNQTVQNALTILKAEGYAVGHAGKGVFVRERPQHLIAPATYISPVDPGHAYPWITDAGRRGLRGSVELLTVCEVVPPAQVRFAFGLDDGQPALLRKQRMLLDGEPAELVHSYYPVDIARGTPLMDRRKIKGGTPRVLAGLGFVPREFVDHVSTRPPTPEEFVALQLPQEVPVLRTFRVVYADDQRPVEATVMVKAGHMYELQYRQVAPSPSD